MTRELSQPQALPCVVGPTASGKSSLADELALHLGSAVLSVDSMQVYRGMDIGTAKVPVPERKTPLLMVDICEPTQDYSVALFQQEARSIINAYLKVETPPVLCGGTGLYLDAVIDEMVFPKGGTSSDSRLRYEALAEELGSEGLHAHLASVDPRSAQLIHPHNVRRVVRALELYDEGVSYADHHEGLLKRAPYYDARIWAIAWPRDVLYQRIEHRVDAMISAGLLKEVEGLMSQGLLKSQTARQAIGYAEMIMVLDGEATIEEAAERMKVRTRRFAKRQLSWLKRDGRTRWLNPADRPWDVFVHDAVRTIAEDLGVRPDVRS